MRHLEHVPIIEPSFTLLNSVFKYKYRSSPKWNWGYASGTGHDCAKICRQKFYSKASRQKLIHHLIHYSHIIDDVSSTSILDEGDDECLDELKLILGLTIQRAQWTGAAGTYLEVLSNLADCQYETFFACDDGIASQRLLLQDMKGRYTSISSDNSLIIHNLSEEVEDLQVSLRQCFGYVLEGMGFIADGM